MLPAENDIIRGDKMASLNEIRLPRGTSRAFRVRPKNRDGSVREYDSGDIVRFGVKKIADTDIFEIKKTAEYSSELGLYVIKLVPEDTANLGNDKKYWYDIGIQTSDGDYYMLIEAAPFYIGKAITGKESS